MSRCPLAKGADSKGWKFLIAKWHVRVFEMRETKRGVLGGRKRVTKGFSWSASGTPEGYLFSSETFATREAAEQDARLRVADEGGTVTSVSSPEAR